MQSAFDGQLRYHSDPRFYTKEGFAEIFSGEVPRFDTRWYAKAMSELFSGRFGFQTRVFAVDEERRAFLRYNYCRYRACLIRDHLLDVGEDSFALAVMLAWMEQAEEQLDNIVRANLALVLAMMRRSGAAFKADPQHVVSEGNAALLRAAEGFEVSRGFRFSTYACRALLKAFSRTAQKAHRIRTGEVMPHDDAAHGHLHAVDPRVDERMADRLSDLREILDSERNPAQLSQPQMFVIRRRFGFEGPPPGKETDELAPAWTLDEIGRELGVTKERVRQLQNKALEKLKKAVEDC